MSNRIKELKILGIFLILLKAQNRNKMWSVSWIDAYVIDGRVNVFWTVPCGTVIGGIWFVSKHEQDGIRTQIPSERWSFFPENGFIGQ